VPVQASAAGNPFDMFQQTCSSAVVVAADGGGMEQFGPCDALETI
jgi:hypothetical protein